MTVTDPFLPADYEVPKKPGMWMKFAPGEMRIRILARPMLGWVGWKTGPEKKFPVHRPLETDFKPGDLDKKEEPKHFWAMPVWNYAVDRVQVLEVTQTTIQKAIKQLAGDADWGFPTEYDIVITAVGDNLKREYAVTPKPAKPLMAEAREEWKEVSATFDITKLWTNGNPFGDDEDAEQAAPGDADIPF